MTPERRRAIWAIYGTYNFLSFLLLASLEYIFGAVVFESIRE